MPNYTDNSSPKRSIQLSKALDFHFVKFCLPLFEANWNACFPLWALASNVASLTAQCHLMVKRDSLKLLVFLRLLGRVAGNLVFFIFFFFKFHFQDYIVGKIIFVCQFMWDVLYRLTILLDSKSIHSNYRKHIPIKW